jgi:hypothetical protein
VRRYMVSSTSISSEHRTASGRRQASPKLSLPHGTPRRSASRRRIPPARHPCSQTLHPSPPSSSTPALGAWSRLVGGASIPQRAVVGWSPTLSCESLGQEAARPRAAILRGLQSVLLPGAAAVLLRYGKWLSSLHTVLRSSISIP